MFSRKMTNEKENKKVIPFHELNYEEIIKENMDYAIYTQEQIERIKNAAYHRNLRNGKYITNKNGLGPDNPCVVGMPDCSNSFFYDNDKDRWILTDGLGNGWIR